MRGHAKRTLDAIEQVYRRRSQQFLRLALAHTGDVERAREAVQEGFARAVRSRASFRGSGSIEAWLARCVINAAHDARSRSARDVPASAVGDTMSADDLDVGSLIVRDAVRELPERQRDALFLRYYLDLDYRSIADALGVEVGTVSATLYAARAALAQALQEVQK